MVKYVLAKDEIRVRFPYSAQKENVLQFSMKINIDKIPKEVLSICKKLEDSNFEAWIVGGSVRDLLLDKAPKDWDITTNAKPDEILSLFSRAFYENAYGTVGVVPYETDAELENTAEALKVIEITPFRGEGIYTDGRRPDEVIFGVSLDEDLKRRDFTINAIAYNPIKDIIKDNHEGLKDIESSTLRTVGNPDERFAEDSLRLLRAIRISTQLGFFISPETLDSIIKNKEGMQRVSCERVRDELIKLLMTDVPMLGFLTLEYTGLLAYIIPELRLGIGMTQTKAHSFDVWGHLLRSMQTAADKNWDLDMRMAALLHDIAKPHTARWVKATNQNSFHGHEVVGEKVSREILSRLKFPQKQIDKVSKLIRWHMFFSDPDQITLSAVRRMVANVSRENIWDLMNLRVCDRVGSGRPKEDPYRLRKYHAMIEEAMKDPINVSMLKIDGKKLMEALNEKPGPKIGLVLNALMAEVFENPEINTEEALVSYATNLIKLDIKELKKLAEKGKLEKDKKEIAEVQKINAKYKVQ